MAPKSAKKFQTPQPTKKAKKSAKKTPKSAPAVSKKSKLIEVKPFDDSDDESLEQNGIGAVDMDFEGDSSNDEGESSGDEGDAIDSDMLASDEDSDMEEFITPPTKKVKTKGDKKIKQTPQKDEMEVKSKKEKKQKTPKAAKTPKKDAETPKVEKSVKKKEKNSKQNSSQEMDESQDSGVGSQDALKQDNVRQADQEKKMLFLKSLPRHTTEEDVRQLIKDPVVIRVKWGGRGKEHQQFVRWVHLEFKSEAMADKHHNLLKGKLLKGKPLLVDYVGSKSEKPKMPQQSTNKSQAQEKSKELDLTRLYISGFGQNCSAEDIKQNFKKAVAVNFPLAKKSSLPKGYAFVQFNDESSAKAAHEEMQGKKLKNGVLLIKYAFKRPDLDTKPTATKGEKRKKEKVEEEPVEKKPKKQKKKKVKKTKKNIKAESDEESDD
ncbi:unnamed protein product [Owenia fusiformis]|uniref:RRM domain-containing protein n=1 Tax=Owenia fusiformis TaxID=6347 RepID=A0A8S4PM78_OWEFU|nr:unnamed protein product [Owenia fusiformis]